METLQNILKKRATEAINKAFCKEIEDPLLFESEVVLCAQKEFGHYQCNNALRLSKILRKNPREVASKIIENFDTKTDQKTPMVASLEIAGPGFINITLDSSYLSDELNHVLNSPHLGVRAKNSHQKVIVEFSSPNIAKELHVGHLRSTIIGDCIARLFEFLGYNVLRLNHVGDWGTQFGMLIAYIKKIEPDLFLGNKKTDLTQLMEFYKKSKALFDEDLEFKKESQNEVVCLQSGDKGALNAWKIICDISRLAFQEIYDILYVHIKERGESFYNPYLQEIVDELDEKGILEVSNGAKCIFIDGFVNREGNPLPIIVQKSDGGFNYDTTDLAGFRHRCFDEKADRIIILTDLGQSLHFQMIHKASIAAGYIDPVKTCFDHVTFGLVLGPDGKKFKTRSGETEKLIDLLKEAIKRAKKTLVERLPAVEESELNELASILGIDAVKYADLSCHRNRDYTFSYDRMLSFEGNTAAFLLYSYVRIMGIKRKIKVNVERILKESRIELSHPSEIALGLHLRRFGEVLEVVAKDLLPNRLTDYLYELAENFNAFFRDCRVQGDDQQNQRLVLCELTARILKQGLNILGLKTLNRM